MEESGAFSMAESEWPDLIPVHRRAVVPEHPRARAAA
jgi:hypothetical protein